MNHCRLVLLCTLFLVPLMAGAFEFHVSQARCSAIDPLLYRQVETCFTALAVQQESIEICESITTPAGVSRCRSNLLLLQPNFWKIFAEEMVLVYYIIFMLAGAVFCKERLAFLYGALSGLLLFALYTLFYYLPFQWATIVAGYYNVTVQPISTVVRYAPDWIHSYNEWWQLVIGYIVVYGQVVSHILLRTRLHFITAGVLLGFAVLLTYFGAEFFEVLHQGLSTISGLFTV